MPLPDSWLGAVALYKEPLPEQEVRDSQSEEGQFLEDVWVQPRVDRIEKPVEALQAHCRVTCSAALWHPLCQRDTAHHRQSPELAQQRADCGHTPCLWLAGGTLSARGLPGIGEGRGCVRRGRWRRVVAKRPSCLCPLRRLHCCVLRRLQPSASARGTLAAGALRAHASTAGGARVHLAAVLNPPLTVRPSAALFPGTAHRPSCKRHLRTCWACSAAFTPWSRVRGLANAHRPQPVARRHSRCSLPRPKAEGVGQLPTRQPSVTASLQARGRDVHCAVHVEPCAGARETFTDRCGDRASLRHPVH